MHDFFRTYSTYCGIQYDGISSDISMTILLKSSYLTASTSVKNTQSLLLKKKYPINKELVKKQIAAIKEILGVSCKMRNQLKRLSINL